MKDVRGAAPAASAALAMAPPGWREALWLCTLAGLALALGGLLYLTDRAATQALLVPNVHALAGLQVFGVLGYWLPSFLHTFAFGLVTAVVLPRQGGSCYVGCAAWFVVNAVFELGQHPALSGPLSTAIGNGLGHGAAARALSNYFVLGRFDPLDIVAAALGAGGAAAVLAAVRRPSEPARA